MIEVDLSIPGSAQSCLLGTELVNETSRIIAINVRQDIDFEPVTVEECLERILSSLDI